MDERAAVIRDCARRFIEVLDEAGNDVVSSEKDLYAIMGDLLALDGLETVVGSPSGPATAVTSFATGWLYYDSELRIVRGTMPGGFAQRPHNHGSWNIFGVYRGGLHYRSYRRMDDGSEPFRADLEVAEDRIMTDGEVTVLPGPPHDIHAITALAPSTVTLLVARGHFSPSRQQYLPELRSYYDTDAATAAQ
jgi:predicted metal-dependent enzyme (double-stranded beta helix superfamily)